MDPLLIDSLPNSAQFNPAFSPNLPTFPIQLQYASSPLGPQKRRWEYSDINNKPLFGLDTFEIEKKRLRRNDTPTE
jgi:hypothetical protein